MRKKLKLKEGENMARFPNEPILHITGRGKQCYLWIGNDADGDKFCFATVSGQKRLKAFAESLLESLSK